MPIADFVSAVQKIYKTGNATEHSYRPALQLLFNSLDRDVSALNEPKRVKVGAPDFAFRRGDISIGHCEAKDLGVDVRKMAGPNAEQKERYRYGLPNLVYTNCLDWVFYRDGQEVGFVSIGEMLLGIQPHPERYKALENLLRDFIAQSPQTITSSKELAERMAGKAALIKDVLFNSLRDDKKRRTELVEQYEAFKEYLIHDMSAEDFADMYAETVAYGLFAARLHDATPGSFSRQEAMELLPKSNPFLRNLFSYVAGPNLDERISWIIDDLAKVFQATNVKSLMKNFGTATGRDDPFLHFYETFLAAYNPAKRKARGVWYTPEPVVKFIVHAVDDILKTDFGLSLGLADTSKVTIDWDTGQRGITKKGAITKTSATVKTTKQIHRVQILDPATGTGTFLADTIKHIAPKIKKVAAGSWSNYVESDLIPRLHGFELLMASYAMCHLKLDMVLSDLEYVPTATPPRLGVYLTNSLEEGDPPNQTLPFAQWLSTEVREANKVKRDMPIMCVIGNPPYSGESANRGEWIGALLEDYKKEPGGKKPLDEKQSKWINNDYVKFIRLASSMIAKNGEGILGFITDNGYLENPTFRGMRWHLLKTFDRLFLLNLHGNSKKRETSPDGSPDVNVFDIQQGVAIVIAVKRATDDAMNKQLAEVLHGDLWGAREKKYEALRQGSLATMVTTALNPSAPLFQFVPKDLTAASDYEAGFSIADLMPLNSSGIITARDELTLDFESETLWRRVNRFASIDVEAARAEFSLGQDRSHWSVGRALADVRGNLSRKNVVPLLYRPFDIRFTLFTGKSNGFHSRPMHNVMQHLVDGKNFALVVPKQSKDRVGAFVTASIAGHKSFAGFDVNSVFPLYLRAGTLVGTTPSVNFDEKLFSALADIASKIKTPSPENVFDYVYGALHCPEYLSKFEKFLKSEFPRIPWPRTAAYFWDVSGKGQELRRLHLMDDSAIGEPGHSFEGKGKAEIDSPRHEGNEVWINSSQYFSDVGSACWETWVGGYQPAKRWLDDRRGRNLEFDEVRHYQKLLCILERTTEISNTIELE